MKREQRAPWLELQRTMKGPPCYDSDWDNTIYALCSWCTYGTGWENDYFGCCHPIWRVREDLSEGMTVDWPADCWAFRPNVKIEGVPALVQADWDRYESEQEDARRDEIMWLCEVLRERAGMPVLVWSSEAKQWVEAMEGGE